MKWQNINLAPKDGTQILVVYGRQSGHPAKVVRYNQMYGYWTCEGKPELGLEQNVTGWIAIPKYIP